MVYIKYGVLVLNHFKCDFRRGQEEESWWCGAQRNLSEPSSISCRRRDKQANEGDDQGKEPEDKTGIQ